jgi:UDP-N-acetylmuramate dehydrogenase
MSHDTASGEHRFSGHPSALIPRPLPEIEEGRAAVTVRDKAMRGELRLREPMARHVSWRAGGEAQVAYFPLDLADLARFVRALPAEEPVHVVGLGSNLLVRDGGLRGTVIFTHRSLRALRYAPCGDGGEIHAEAGVASPKVARFAALHDLSGAEFLAGIPGTVGGALAMNAGCFGGETWEIVAKVTTLNRAGALRERAREDYDIDYRRVQLKAQGARDKVQDPQPSALSPQPSEEWFVAATFKLKRGSSKDSRRKIAELLKRRIATQPLNDPNAGSVFRNPKSDYAARMIEACGLKGHAIGGAAISDKHANFIVNRGGARAADIEALIELAERRVKEKFGIVLEREVRIVGDQ